MKNKEESNKDHSDKETIESSIQRQNEGLGLPLGLYHSIHLNGANFSVEIVSPCHTSSIADCVHFAQWLSLFISDDVVKNKTKKQILDMLNKPIDDEED